MWGAFLGYLCSGCAKRRSPRTEVPGPSVFKTGKRKRGREKSENKESDFRKLKEMECHRSKGRVCQETDLSESNFCGSQIVFYFVCHI